LRFFPRLMRSDIRDIFAGCRQKRPSGLQGKPALLKSRL